MTREEFAALVRQTAALVANPVGGAFDGLAREVFARPAGDRLQPVDGADRATLIDPGAFVEAVAVGAATIEPDPQDDPDAAALVAALAGAAVVRSVRGLVLDGLDGDRLAERLAAVRALKIADAGHEAATVGRERAAGRSGLSGRVVLSVRACRYCRGFSGMVVRPGSGGGPPFHSGCACFVSWGA